MAPIAAAFGAVFVAGGATVAQVAIVGAVTGAVVGGIKAAVSGENILKGAIVGGVIGGATGALAGWASGAATSVPAAGGGTTWLPTAAETAASNAANAAATGAASGTISTRPAADAGMNLSQISTNTAANTGQTIGQPADVLGNFAGSGQSQAPSMFSTVQYPTSIDPLLTGNIKTTIPSPKPSFLNSPYAVYGASNLLGSVVEGIGGQQEKEKEIQALKDLRDEQYNRINNVSPTVIRNSMPTYRISMPTYGTA